MILEQMYLPCLAQASYFLADPDAGEAAVVDPRRDVEDYLRRAEELGVRISKVFLTHFHADFVSGHLELRDRVGATIHLGHRAQAEYEFQPLREGDVLSVGAIRVEVLETPGHTPEGVSLVVREREGEPPRAVLTGDALFVGGVGRPDLMVSAGLSAEELAGMLYDSLHDKLLRLPDETLVYPAHGPGSLCGKKLGDETFSTIGAQRASNEALRAPSREAFVAEVTDTLPTAPRYFAHDAALNRQERPVLEAALAALEPVGVERLRRAMAEGETVLDARSADAFAEGHLPGSVQVGLDGRFATWAGSVLDPTQPVWIVAPTGREREAALRLGRVGFTTVRGYLADAEAALARDAALRRSDRREPAAIHAEAERRIVDVRTAGEFAQGAPRDAINIPLAELPDRLAELPSGPLALSCQTGYRSSCAASLLARAGRGDVVDLRGGFEAWSRAGLPLQSPDPAQPAPR